MGRKRKSAKFGNSKKAKEKTPTSFDCPFCTGSRTVACVLDRDRLLGTVRCLVCEASFSTKINPLSEAIDVYSEWIDACEEVNQ
eukprot:g1234.t1